MTDRPSDKRLREELRERAEALGWDTSELSDQEIEERILETERRKEQLQEAWRRRRTVPAPGENRPGDGRGGRRRSP